MTAELTEAELNSIDNGIREGPLDLQRNLVARLVVEHDMQKGMVSNVTGMNDRQSKLIAKQQNAIERQVKEMGKLQSEVKRQSKRLSDHVAEITTLTMSLAAAHCEYAELQHLFDWREAGKASEDAHAQIAELEKGTKERDDTMIRHTNEIIKLREVLYVIRDGKYSMGTIAATINNVLGLREEAKT